ncbi:MAG: hypothetical protein DSM106950_42075 [Stigonema ocellatum SAG 48.90 = DSM 106950]|nr:hypothetical protein [Stigonema ocellatum SAG 48.90 = DSM 106950]
MIIFYKSSGNIHTIESDILLSVLVPAAATEAAAQVAEVITSVGKSILYVDANAISPLNKVYPKLPTSG